jgi:hypothetical protein
VVRVFEFERTRQSVSLCAAYQADEVAHTGVTAVRAPPAAHRTIIPGDAPTAADELSGRSDLAATACPPMLKRGGGRFQSQKLRPRITGQSSSRAELAKGEDPKALFDAAVTELRAREC